MRNDSYCRTWRIIEYLSNHADDPGRFRTHSHIRRELRQDPELVTRCLDLATSKAWLIVELVGHMKYYSVTAKGIKALKTYKRYMASVDASD